MVPAIWALIFGTLMHFYILLWRLSRQARLPEMYTECKCQKLTTLNAEFICSSRVRRILASS